MTVIFGALALWVVWSIIDWGVLHAVWRAENREICLRGSGGACWAVIDARWRLIQFGLYPFEDHWRSALACAAIVLVGILSCLPTMWNARRLAGLWVGGFVVFYMLMRGACWGLPKSPCRIGEG